MNVVGRGGASCGDGSVPGRDDTGRTYGTRGGPSVAYFPPVSTGRLDGLLAPTGCDALLGGHRIGTKMLDNPRQGLVVWHLLDAHSLGAPFP